MMKRSIIHMPLFLAASLLAAAEPPLADDFERADTVASGNVGTSVGPAWFNGGTVSPYLIKGGNFYPMPPLGAMPLLIHGGIGTSESGFETTKP